jgi:hypothetical protein
MSATVIGIGAPLVVTAQAETVATSAAWIAMEQAKAAG